MRFIKKLSLLALLVACLMQTAQGEGKAKIEVRNDRKDLVVTAGDKVFPYNTVVQLDEVLQKPEKNAFRGNALTIAEEDGNRTRREVWFFVELAGASEIEFKNDPLFRLPIIPAQRTYGINRGEYPGSTLVISSPEKSDVVLWGNSPMGSKAQVSDVYQLPSFPRNNSTFTVVREVVYESGERKAKIYIK